MYTRGCAKRQAAQLVPATQAGTAAGVCQCTGLCYMQCSNQRNIMSLHLYTHAYGYGTSIYSSVTDLCTQWHDWKCSSVVAKLSRNLPAKLPLPIKSKHTIFTRRSVYMLHSSLSPMCMCSPLPGHAGHVLQSAHLPT